MTHNDIYPMQHALRLAAQGLGRTWPNPSVGAVVIKAGVLVAQGITARGGRPHAETQALAMAGEAARDATLYVTLEPCVHEGKTPPCTDAIIASGIKRVVSACTDANPLVSGKGFARLREAGIEVTEGVCEAEARAMNEGFFSVMERKRPFVTLKVATSLDGKIADAQGKSRWITGKESRARVHLLRARHDALLTGIGTVLADDPELNCRLPGLEEDSPQRVVLDSSLRIAPAAKALPAWIFTSATMAATAADAQKKKVALLEKAGSRVFAVKEQAARLSLNEVLEKLATLGVTRLMVEAGSQLASEMMRHDLIDRLYWFRAPLVIGETGLAAFTGRDGLALDSLPRLQLQGQERCGPDWLEIYGALPKM